MIESKEITNPFPGLRPFETDEYRLFFGREGQSDALIARLQRSHFLAVVGTSGSGKSSLVRAGLLPALRGGLMAGAGSGWRITIMRPGSDPIGNLALALAQKDVLLEAGGGLPPAEAEAVIEATLRRGALGLADAARQARLNEHEKLLVVVDQFEELFRFRAARPSSSTGDDASAFVKLLLEAAQQSELSIYVVPTMRSDFLGDCAQFQGLPEAINDGQYLIPRMTRDERRFAITGPVGVKRRKITEPLVNRLMNDVGDNPDQLPILQHALMRTWDHWSAHRRNGEPIGLEHYEAIGAMSDALSLHADEAFNELPDERSRLIAEKLFKALTERGADNREIRRPTTLNTICEIAGASLPEVATVIEVFRGGGRSFLMPPTGVALRPETVIDISHESLIRNWTRLQQWVDEEAQSSRIYRRLVDRSLLHREGTEEFLQGAALSVAVEWREQWQPNSAWATRYHPDFDAAMNYLDASVQYAEEAPKARVYQRLAEAAVLHRDGKEGLLVDPGLQVALDWYEKTRPTFDWAKRYHPEFELAIAYLEESKRGRDASIAERERQRNAELERERREREQAEAYAAGQARAARRLRWLVAGMTVMFLLALATAAYALSARADAERNRNAAQASLLTANAAKEQVERSYKDLNKAKEFADAQKTIADEKAKDAEAANKRTEVALESQKLATARANEQKRAAERSQRDAQTNFRVAMISQDRSARHLNGIAEFQRGSYDQALNSLNNVMEGVDIEEQASKSVNYPSQQKKDLVMNELKGTRSAVLRDIAATQRKLGQYEEAVRSNTKALQLQTEHEANVQWVTATPLSEEERRRRLVTWNLFDATYGLAQSYHGLAERRSRIAKTNDDEDYLKAEEYYTQALALQEKLLHDEPGVTYSVDPTSGETILEGRQALNLADGLENLARFYSYLAKYEKAEPLYERILKIREKEPEVSGYRATLTEVGKFYLEQGKYQDAEKMFEKAVEGQDPFGFAEPDEEALRVLPDMYNNLSEVYGAQEGKEAKAQAAFQFSRALRDYVQTAQRLRQNEDAKGLSAVNESMADAYAGLGNYKQAAAFYETAFSLQQYALDLESIWRLTRKRAEVNRYQLHNFEKAEDLYKQRLESVESEPDKGPARLPEALRDLGSLYAGELNRPTEAEPLLKRSLELYSNAPKGTYPALDVNKSLVELAKLYRRQNRIVEMENAQKTRAEYAGRFLSDALGLVSTNNPASLSSYTDAAREYLEANGELAARYREQHKEDDLFALYRAMLGNPTKPAANPASCCIRIDSLVNVSVFAIYLKTLEEYRQLLIAQGMKEEAAKIAEYVHSVERMKESAKKYQHLFQ